MAEGIKDQLKTIEAYADIVGRFSEVPGYLAGDEGFALCLLASGGPGQGVVVEIGSFKGRSTCFLAWGSKLGDRGSIIAIDHFAGSPEHQRGAAFEVAEIVCDGTTFPSFQANLTAAGLLHQVEPLRMSTAQAARDWTRAIRLLFIDGDHDYEATKRDFELFAPFVVAGGIVCFHDVGDWPGVTRFYHEICVDGGWRPEFQVRSLAALSKQ